MNLTVQSLIDGVMPYVREVGIVVSTCSLSQPLAIADPASGFDAGGAPVTGPGSYVPVAGLQNLQCMDAPPSNSTIAGAEVKSASEILGLRFRHVFIPSYHPEIPKQNQNWQASVTDRFGATEVWDLVGSDADSQSTQTRLDLRQGQI